MSTTGYNEGVSVLAEFVCPAIPAPLATVNTNGSHHAPTTPEASNEKSAQLETLDARKLLAMLKDDQLCRADLVRIHEIALSRLNGGSGSATTDLVELLRAAMRALEHRP